MIIIKKFLQKAVANNLCLNGGFIISAENIRFNNFVLTDSFIF